MNPKIRQYIRRKRLLKRFGYNCSLCGKPMSVRQVTIDHIIPKSWKITHGQQNKQLAHGRCNAKKGDRLLPTKE